MESNSALRCTHCLIPVKDTRGIYDSKGRIFCCKGCLGVYHLLHEQGLEEFYRRRKNWRPGPVQYSPVKVEQFKDCVTLDGAENSKAVLNIHVGGIRCASCVWLIERFLKKQKGVLSVRVNYGTHSAQIVFDPQSITLKQILESFSKIGYKPIPLRTSYLIETTLQYARQLLVRFGTGAFFSMQVMLLSIALYAGYFQGIEPIYKKAFQFIAWALATPVVFYAGSDFVKGAWRLFAQMKPSMDALVGLGSLSAYVYSCIMLFSGGEVYFDSACMIVTIILLGRYIETIVRANSLKELLRLVEITPEEAVLVIDNNITKHVPVQALKIGQTVEVLQGERFPIDGVIIDGYTEVDESLLTGESKPVIKKKGDEVFAGSINLHQTVRIKVSRLSSETLVQKIIKAVQEAQSRRSPVQCLADRIAGFFVPFIIIVAAITGLYWSTVATYKDAILNATAVLIVACPCALGLATPMAILRATASATAIGVVVKNTEAFELIPRASVLCLDKTGTLTENTFTVQKVFSFGALSQEELLRLASSIEAKTNHPLKKAFKDFPSDEPVEDVISIPGKGVIAKIKNQRILLGSKEFLKQNGIDVKELSVSDDMIVLYMAIEDHFEAAFIIHAPLKPYTKEIIQFFKNKDVRVVLLSGDRQTIVNAIARKLQFDEAKGALTPFDKADYIKNLVDMGEIVIMVGDGINDAPALKEASVGIASYNATDLAIESADVAILREDIGLLKRIFLLSKKTMAIIKENFIWAFGYNFLTIPLAAVGKLHPVVSAILMVISSLMVVMNSLRIKRS